MKAQIFFGVLLSPIRNGIHKYPRQMIYRKKVVVFRVRQRNGWAEDYKEGEAGAHNQLQIQMTPQKMTPLPA